MDARQKKKIHKKQLRETCPGVEKYRDGTDFVFPEDPQGGVFLLRPGVEGQGKGNRTAYVSGPILNLNLESKVREVQTL